MYNVCIDLRILFNDFLKDFKKNYNLFTFVFVWNLILKYKERRTNFNFFHIITSSERNKIYKKKAIKNAKERHKTNEDGRFYFCFVLFCFHRHLMSDADSINLLLLLPIPKNRWWILSFVFWIAKCWKFIQKKNIYLKTHNTQEAVDGENINSINIIDEWAEFNLWR